jgi:hypothetical protein
LVILSSHDCGETVYINKKARVEVPYNDCNIIIDGFFLVDCSIPRYDIVAGIGRNGERRFLFGMALSDGHREHSQIFEYIGIPVPDSSTEKVKSDLDIYRKSHKLDAEILLWSELLADQK